MKLSLVMFLGVFCASAAGAQEASPEPTDRRFCEFSEGIASIIMAGRQSGLLMSDAIKNVTEKLPTLSDAFKDQPEAKGQLKTMAEDLAIHAYDRPRYPSEELRKNGVVEFASQQYSQCLQAIRAGKN